MPSFASKRRQAGKHFAPNKEQIIKVVSIGGGTGQSNTIKALISLGIKVSAVVSMVDDGGSTGILRDKAQMLATGDVRRCLSAMAQDGDEPLVKAFEHRFPYADNHSLGNLILTALTQETDSFAEAIDLCARLLHIKGAVLPSTLEPVTLAGKTKDGQEFAGEACLGKGPAALEQVWLEPKDAQVYQPVLQAILEADAIVLGPGSLFTSIIPNLLVPGILSAIKTVRKKRKIPLIFVGPIADMQGETWGLSTEEHVLALEAHGLKGLIDVALLHKRKNPDLGVATRSFQALTREQVAQDAFMREQSDGKQNFVRPVDLQDGALERLNDRIPVVLCRDFSEEGRPTWHSVCKLASALKGVIPACHLAQK